MGRLLKKKLIKKKAEEKITDGQSEQIDTTKLQKISTSFQPRIKSVTKEEKDNFFNRAVQFFKEAKSEIKKVTWPTRKQSIAATVAVIILIIVVSLFLGMIDSGLSWLIKLILS